MDITQIETLKRENRLLRRENHHLKELCQRSSGMADFKKIEQLSSQRDNLLAEIERLKSLPLLETSPVEPQETEVERKAWEFYCADQSSSPDWSSAGRMVESAFRMAEVFIEIRNARRQEAAKSQPVTHVTFDDPTANYGIGTVNGHPAFISMGGGPKKAGK